MFITGSYSLAAASLGVAAALLLFITVTSLIYNLYFHPLSKFPGPFLARTSRAFFIRSTWNGTLHFDVKELHDRYGSVVRIAPDELSFIDPAAWKDIYGHGTKGRQPPVPDPTFYNVVFVPGSFVRLDGRHDLVRKLLNPGFSTSALRDQQPLVESYANLLVSKITQASNGGKDFIDAVQWYEYLTFDVISALAFGQSFNALQSSAHHPWSAAIPAAIKMAQLKRAIYFVSSSLYEALSYLLARTAAKKRAYHFKMTRDLVNQRMSKTPEYTDFVHKLVEPGSGITEQEMVAIASFLTIAGSETAATALAGMMSLLCRNPDAHAKLKAEVRDAFATTDDITCESVKDLTYLGAVIEEALRVFPPASYFPRRTPLVGCEIAGTWVPGDMALSVVQWAANRSAANFRDPEQFVPERWLGDERYQNDRRDAVMPFSVGPRSCIGINLAYLEMRLVLAKVVWHFDLALQKPAEEWTAVQKLYTTFEKEPLLVKMTPVHRQ